MFNEQLTLHRIPLVLVGSAILFAGAMSAMTYRIVAQYPATIQAQGVKSEIDASRYAYSSDYHTVFGRRFIKFYGRWNHFNFQRQMLFAMDMASEGFRSRMQERYARDETITKTLKVTHMSYIHEMKVMAVDRIARTTQVDYLVEELEWYAGTKAGAPHWYRYSMLIRDIESEKVHSYLAVIDGMDRQELVRSQSEETVVPDVITPFATTATTPPADAAHTGAPGRVTEGEVGPDVTPDLVPDVKPEASPATPSAPEVPPRPLSPPSPPAVPAAIPTTTTKE